jgi:hypothetical protein
LNCTPPTIQYFLGARGFAADLIILNTALTKNEVEGIYRPISSQHHLIRPLSIALNFLSFHHSLHGQRKYTPVTQQDQDLELLDLSVLQAQCESCSQQSDCKMKTWYDLLGTPSSPPPTSDYAHLLQDIDNAIGNCVPPLIRLDLYAEGSILGHVESLYKWSMLLGFGSEIPANTCGIEEFTPSVQQYHRVVYSLGEDQCSHITIDMISDQIKAVVGLMGAVQLGHSGAFIPLSTFLTSSIGMGIFSLNFKSPYGRCLLKKLVEYVPFPTISFHSNGTNYFSPISFIHPL